MVLEGSSSTDANGTPAARTNRWADRPTGRLDSEVELTADETRNSTEKKAFELWIQRGCPTDSAFRDWQEAEAFVNWQTWVETCLRPYLAVEVTANPENLASQLCESEGALGRQVETTVRQIVVLDGSPEFSRNAKLFRSGNCVPPETYVERRDTTFFEHCLPFVDMYDGKALVNRTNGGGSTDNGEQIKKRPFQDGFAGVFPRFLDSITAAFQMRQVLNQTNSLDGRTWNEQFHLRVSIGRDWNDAVRGVRYAWRDQIVASPELIEGIEDASLLELLIASGVRVGLREEEQA